MNMENINENDKKKKKQVSLCKTCLLCSTSIIEYLYLKKKNHMVDAWRSNKCRMSSLYSHVAFSSVSHGVMVRSLFSTTHMSTPCPAAMKMTINKLLNLLRVFSLKSDKYLIKM